MVLGAQSAALLKDGLVFDSTHTALWNGSEIFPAKPEFAAETLRRTYELFYSFPQYTLVAKWLFRFGNENFRR